MNRVVLFIVAFSKPTNLAVYQLEYKSSHLNLKRTRASKKPHPHLAIYTLDLKTGDHINSRKDKQSGEPTAS